MMSRSESDFRSDFEGPISRGCYPVIFYFFNICRPAKNIDHLSQFAFIFLLCGYNRIHRKQEGAADENCI